MGGNEKGALGQHLLVIVFFSMLLIMAFATRWIRGETLFLEVIWDPIPVYYFYPADKVAIETYHAGQIPDWDPFRGFGNPQINHSGGGLFYPLRVMAYLLDSIPGWELYLLLRFLMAGFFTYLLARALRLGFAAAMLSGTAFMLCGYFREFHNFVNLNAEVLVPLEMLILFKLAKRPRLSWLIAYSLVWVLMGTAPHPEATFYSLGYCFIFFCFVLIIHVRTLARPAKVFFTRLFLFIAFIILGLLWSGYALFPFIEYLDLSWNYHFPGIGQLHIPLNHLIALITPLFDFWLHPSTSHIPEPLRQFTLIPGYLGVVISGLVILALLGLRRLPSIALFFVLMILLYFGIIFYLPAFSLVNHLPVVKDMQNFRYAQPYLAFSAAMLAGFAIDMIARTKLRLRILMIPFSILILWILAEGWLFRHELLHSGLALKMAVMSGACIIVSTIIVAFGWRMSWLESRARAVAVMAVLLAVSELLIYFIMVGPLYGRDAFRIQPPEPYIKFLKNRKGLEENPGPFRVYGLAPELLHPNLGGLYKVADIRDQSPLYLDRYARFFSKINGWKSDADRVDHFLERGRFYFDLNLHRAPAGLLNLINLRYIMSFNEPGHVPVQKAASVGMITAPHPHFFSSNKISINGKGRDSFFLHAPSGVELEMNSLPGETLHLEAGIMERSWKADGFDGASLSVIAHSSSSLKSSDRLLFFRFIDPKTRKGERRWMPVEFSIPFKAPFRLTLASKPGPAGNNQNDYTLYGELSIGSENPLPEWRLVYDRECRIYENPSVLARAFWVPRAEYYSSDDEILAKMMESDFEPEDAVLLVGEMKDKYKITENDAQVKIEAYQFGKARIKVMSEHPGWLVLTDLYFPGWLAEVDGNPSRILHAYSLFRAVQVPAGGHEVLFQYFPWPLRIGIWFFIAGMVAMVVSLLLKRSRIFIPQG